MKNLQKILEARNIKKRDIARHVFPGHAYPYEAFKRLLKGESLMQESHILKITEFLGVDVGDLYKDLSVKGKASKDLIVFKSALGWRAEYAPSTKLLSIRDQLGTEIKGVKIDTSDLSVSDFIEEIEYQVALANVPEIQF